MTDSRQSGAEALGYWVGIFVMRHREVSALICAMSVWAIALISLTLFWSISKRQPVLEVLLAVITLFPLGAYMAVRAVIDRAFPLRMVSEAESSQAQQGVQQVIGDVGEGLGGILKGLEGLIIGLVVLGLIIWAVIGLFSAAPWWAVVIILLLVALLLK